MVKLCDEYICKSLKIIFNSYLIQGIFPSEWKKGNVVPKHKKNNKQCYHPASLLPICSKVFELLIYDSMFSHLLQNNLISENQCFYPGDYCVNQF